MGKGIENRIRLLPDFCVGCTLFCTDDKGILKTSIELFCIMLAC